MKILFWIIQILIILAFIPAGIPKLFMPIDQMIAQGMHWMEDFSEMQIRIIGVLETLAILGLTLPYFIKALPKILVPLAAGGLALTMAGAVITHITRQDPALSITITTLLTVLCASLAVYRFKQ